MKQPKQEEIPTGKTGVSEAAQRKIMLSKCTTGRQVKTLWTTPRGKKYGEARPAGTRSVSLTCGFPGCRTRDKLIAPGTEFTFDKKGKPNCPGCVIIVCDVTPIVR